MNFVAFGRLKTVGRQVHDWSQGQEHAVYLYIANSSNAFSDFEWLFVLWSQFVVPRSLLPWSETPSCSSLSSKWIFSLSPWEKMTVPSALKKLLCRSTPTAEQAWVQKECRARRCSPASGQQETKQLPCNGHGHRALTQTETDLPTAKNANIKWQERTRLARLDPPS